ncbi:universal stress protein [Thermodesulfobacteriota bacterium]
MYEKILIPLDGSKLAECVLPHVEAIATGCQTPEVMLISITELIKVRQVFADGGSTLGQQMLDGTVGTAVPSPEAPSGAQVYDGVLGKMDTQARKYLDRIAKDLEGRGILNVTTKVLLGDPAAEIAALAEEGACDLIIMASHGRTGPARWVFGSVSEKVFRSSCVPVMMIRGPGCTL